jgi:uncharacterized protein YfdQ (DUF2303 family)
MHSETNTAADIIRGLAGASSMTVAGMPIIVAPRDMQVHKFPELVAPPLIVTRSKIAAHDVAGFIDYINTFKLDTSRIFAALEPKPKLHAIIDYHAVKGAQHCLHTVTCDLAHSEEWKRWTVASGTRMDQKSFGTFVEDNLKDVLEPSGGELMQMALNFTSMRDVEFGSSTRLSSGEVQFSYKEKERTGEVKLPERIRLALPVFRGDEQAYSIWARVKYQLKEQKLEIWFELERPDLIVDAAYKAVIKEVGEKTSIAPFRGMPAQSQA